ncbi:MAG: right-handed parallel beta-helix repeat-containing protein [Myxococcota bacterium]|nr:right-handed parallel beta-helix repeat-containing protein [Myxococcota bacterium]
MLRISFLLALLLLIGLPAGGVDGVREINQACVNTGCFPGDSAGFPVTIASSGSYRLTSNLRFTSELGVGPIFDVIQINVDDVALDLGGFVLSCRLPSVNFEPCTGSAAGGNGISSNRNNIEIRNGTVRNMSGRGLVVGFQSHVENVRALSNGGDGIVALTGSVIRGCRATDNGEAGIVAGADSVVVENTSTFNTTGFEVAPASVVAHNVASNNSGDGFDLGFFGGTSNSQGGLATENAAQINGGFGLRMEARWGFRGNVLTLNGGTTTGGVNLGGNLCGTNTSCP